MSQNRSLRPAPMVASLLVLCAAFGELLMRELFHRIHGEILHLVALCAIALAIVLLQGVLDRFWGATDSRPSRLPFVFACCVYVVMVVPAGELDPGSVIASPGWFAHKALFFVSAILLACCGLANQVRWMAIRRAAVFAAIVFVVAQPVLVKWRANDVSWPRSAAAPGAVVGADRLVVYVLLDELNSNRAPAIVAALQDEGLQVNWKPVMPKGDGTAKVVPALFMDKDFSETKPCSLSATCSGDSVLDFARVHASRPDIDIVGFSHPYCAIQGLRWCRREAVPTELFVEDYWKCAIWRRTGLFASLSARTCDSVFRHGWNAMLDNTLADIDQAPAWRLGGMLYLHVPLPHPPGRLIRQGLAENYEDSVLRAASLVRAMARRGIRSGRRVTFVVFSDHPLRGARWCTSLWSYSSLGCVVSEQLQDKYVPFIVAGNAGLPSIETIRTNSQVFDLRLP